MSDSEFLSKAKLQIESVRGHSLSSDERRQAAITLAAFLMQEAKKNQTPDEIAQLTLLQKMMESKDGKTFATAIVDQCLRPKNPRRAADQLIFLIRKYGVPEYLPSLQRFLMRAAKIFGRWLPSITISEANKAIRQQTIHVILPAEPKSLKSHYDRRHSQGIKLNLNYLGEAILGEKEARERFELYTNYLKEPFIDYISIKISTLYSQINLYAEEESLTILADRFRALLTTAKEEGNKFINLDMEEYRDLHLTIKLFKSVLSEESFMGMSAGIVLQAYLPDTFNILKELTNWAMDRVKRGGNSIKIRVVKGANRSMEMVEASIKNWPLPTYDTKTSTDANFKRMISFALNPEHVKAVRIGIGSHNIFDIAYAILLSAENNVDEGVDFEMLEGMAPSLTRAIKQLTGRALLYCPVTTAKDFHFAVAYLMRRLDENTSRNNFLRNFFGLVPGQKEWQNQATLFSMGCEEIELASDEPRKQQDRRIAPKDIPEYSSFENEPDTDFSLAHNIEWGVSIRNSWIKKTFIPIPKILAGIKQEIEKEEKSVKALDPSRPGHVLYTYSPFTKKELELTLQSAEKSHKRWASTSPAERSALLSKTAQALRHHRGELIGSMLAEAAKPFLEADTEVSEAIDFADYYRRNLEEISGMQDIQWSSKGVVLVAPPWNFPCSIPAGCILSSLAAGNVVLFKPAPEAILTGWTLVNILWEAGIDKELLHFIPCQDEPEGSWLIHNPRISTVILTGSTETAKQFLRLRPSLDLIAETGGKNAMIITAMSDREQGIRDTIASAFSYAGQKCSACSLLICEAEVYDDAKFMETLKDAAASLVVGSAWNPTTKVPPLIRPANEKLQKALTSLDEGETWLLKPQQDLQNPQLWSPGIKLGVKPRSFMHQTELFGPVLGVMRADDLNHAVRLANDTPYGLTAGLHSLDPREHSNWLSQIQAGNCYINRGITGAVVQRQPFGGCKASSFGKGAKAGGPNYLMQLLKAKQKGEPQEIDRESGEFNKIALLLEKSGFSSEELHQWNQSLGSYLFYWKNYFSKDHDPSKVLGQNNILRYIPRHGEIICIQADDHILDVWRVALGAAICGTSVEIICEKSRISPNILQEWNALFPKVLWKIQSNKELIKKLIKSSNQRVRFLSKPSEEFQIFFEGTQIIHSPVLANGRIELLNYLREVSISYDYHRYGYTEH